MRVGPMGDYSNTKVAFAELRNYSMGPPVRSTSVVASSLRLRTSLLRLRTQLPLRQLLQPTRLPLHGANLEVILSSLAAEHLCPSLNRLLDLLPRIAQLLLPVFLLLCSNVLLVKVRDVDRDVRPLCAAQVGRRVFSKAASDESARGVLACEDVVASTWTIDAAASGNVVDRAIEREVDRLVGVASVVGEELGVSQGDGTLLYVAVSFVIFQCFFLGWDLRSIS
jgi:hypothetical protein